MLPTSEHWYAECSYRHLQHSSLRRSIDEQHQYYDYQKIQQSFQDNQQALAKAQQEKMQAITTKVLDAIKTVGQSGGYVYIMEMGAGIPYISTTLSTDVTAQVKTQLGLK